MDWTKLAILRIYLQHQTEKPNTVYTKVLLANIKKYNY